MIAKPNIFDCKSQEVIKAFREWSRVLEKYLSAVDDYMKGLKEIHEKPN